MCGVNEMIYFENQSIAYYVVWYDVRTCIIIIYIIPFTILHYIIII